MKLLSQYRGLSWHRLRKMLAQLISWSLLLLLTLSLIGQWVRDVTVELGFLLYLPLLPLSVLAVLWDISARGRTLPRLRFALSGLALVAFAVIFSTMKGQAVPPAHATNAAGFSVLHWNVLWGGNQHWSEFTELMQAQPVDVVLISEPPSMWELNHWQQQLSEHSTAEWSLLIEWPLAIYSAHPIRKKATLTFSNGMGVLVEVTPPSGLFRILFIDGKRDLSQPRHLLLHSILAYMQLAEAAGQPIHIIAGDFNSLGRSRGFDQWHTAGYQLAAQQAGQWRGSWPSWLPLYDIDHIWLHPSLSLQQFHFLFHAKTDHRGQRAQVVK